MADFPVYVPKTPPAGALTVAQVLEKTEYMEYVISPSGGDDPTSTHMCCSNGFVGEVKTELRRVGLRMVIEVKFDTTTHFWIAPSENRGAK